jgi:hypothetical protein
VGIAPPPNANTVIVELPPGATNSKASVLDVPDVVTAPEPPLVPEVDAAFKVVVN